MSFLVSSAVVKMNQHPLVVRFGALGDMTILTVMIRLLHERFGAPVDILGSGGWTRPLLEGQPGVGELYLVGSRRWPYFVSPEQWRLTQALRERGPGPTWFCDHGNSKVFRVLRRAGWRAEHCCHYLDIQDLPGPHTCVVTELQRRALDAWLIEKKLAGMPLILIQVGNKRTMRRGARARTSNSKYWPEENWAAVLRGLRERHPSHAVLMLGVPQEATLNDEILQLAKNDSAINVAHDAPIPRLIALAERAVGMISVDTGPAHVAAAVGCPVVTLFGKSNPNQYAPRGPNASVACLTGMQDGEQSMLGVSVEQVLAAWQSIVRTAT
jgi:heptosyltransferase-3